MFIRNAVIGSALALTLAGGTTLMAQVTTGALNGRVMDAKGRPVADARVALESPALFQTRILKTDARGEYRAQLLPVGTYRVRVSRDGYLGQTSEGTRVGVGMSLSLDFMLKPMAEASATVEVVADRAVESKADDKVSVNFSAEELLKLPATRTFTSALGIAQGVTEYGIRGANQGSYNQTLYRINGLEVNDSSGESLTIYEPLPDSIEDIQVVLSALNARNGRTQGGQVNIVTKSGSNTFSGSIRSDLSRPSWQTNLTHGPTPGGGSSSYESNATESYSRLTDITMSGPIIKDRLWFYMGTRLQPSVPGTTTLGWTGYVDGNTSVPLSSVVKYPMTTYGNFPEVDNVLTDPSNFPTLGGNQARLYDLVGDSAYGKVVSHNTKFQKYEGKLTGQVNENHVLSFTYLYQKTTTGNQSGERTNGFETIDMNMMGNQVDETKAWTLGWDGILASNWFIEARVYRAGVSQADVVGTRQYPIFVQSYLTTGNRDTLVVEPTGSYQDWGESTWFGPFYNMRSSSSITPNKRGNANYSVNIKTNQDWMGQHEVDFGGELFHTIHQFGREREGNRGIFEGGFIYEPVSGQKLFPVFYTTSGWNGSESLLNQDDAYDRYLCQGYPMQGPGAHMEQYWTGGGEARNESQSLWVNDSWQVNDHWNIMLGLRYNHFILKDTDSRDLTNLKIFEPRFQVKWNPDGKGSEIISFSAAKLASAYSDEMASNFRASSWSVRTIHGWTGLHDASGTLIQPSVDSDAALTDTVTGVVDTGVSGALPVSYNGANMYGVRWVTYADLINTANYGGPVTIVDTRQTFRTDGLQVPYTIELALGYTHAWATGTARVNLVQRTYKKEWISYLNKGYYDATNPYAYLTEVKDPSGTGTGHPSQWQQTYWFTNSDLKKVYRDVELSWSERITPRLEFAGNYTYSQTTGRYTWDYYQYRDEKIKEGLSENVYAPEGVLSRSQQAHVWLVYTHPVGKGQVTASIMTTYSTAGLVTLGGSNRLNVTAMPSTIAGMAVKPDTYDPTYSVYYSGLGAYKSGADTTTTDMKLQAQMPVGLGLLLTAELWISNVFNRVAQNDFYDWRTYEDFYRPNGYDQPIPGRPLASFNNRWGYAGDHRYFADGRSLGCSVGLKF